MAVDIFFLRLKTQIRIELRVPWSSGEMSTAAGLTPVSRKYDVLSQGQLGRQTLVVEQIASTIDQVFDRSQA